MAKSPNLDVPLLELAPNTYWTCADALRHSFISGDSGSGKTSGSGAAMRTALLKSGAGALVLVAKPEEADLWRGACKKAGRLGSLIEFNGRNSHAFNFLRYEMARQTGDGINSVVECLLRVVEATRTASASPGKDGEQFWLDSIRILLRHSLPVIVAATDNVTIPDIIEFVRTAPRSPEEMQDAEWQRRSFFFRTLMASEHALPKDVGEKMISYWLNEFAVLDAKTRGNIVVSLTTTLDRFNHGWMQRAFCDRTTFVPELCFNGAIILLDMPALTLNEDGIVAQILFKFIWQRAMLSRNALPPKQRVRLCFLWIDEYQMFTSSYDPQFLSACRASMVATVLLTQSLPTLYATMPGDNARDKVDQLVGLCATKIWHSTSCTHTAKWAADMIGRTLHQRGNFSAGDSYSENRGTTMGLGDNWGGNSSSGASFGSSTQDGKTSYNSSHSTSSGSSWGGNANYGRSQGFATSRSRNAGWSEAMDHIIEPADFGRMLKTGGKANRGVVTGIWYQSGRNFATTGSNFMLAEFQQ
jgi:hypothetical protein